MSKVYIVVVSSITEKGQLPQFYGEFDTQLEARKYEQMWKKLAANAKQLISFDRKLRVVS